MSSKSKKLQAILDKTVDHKKVFGATFAIKHQEEIWHGVAGNIKASQDYFIASTTKQAVVAFTSSNQVIPNATQHTIIP